MLTTAYTTRTARAQRILEAGLVTPWHLDAGEWRVKSETNEDVTYNVNVKAGECPCPDHAKGFYCKHLIAASKAAALMARARRGEWVEELDEQPAPEPPSEAELEQQAAAMGES